MLSIITLIIIFYVASHENLFFSFVGFLLIVSVGPLIKSLTGVESTSLVYFFYWFIYFSFIIVRQRYLANLFSLLLIVVVLILLFFQMLIVDVSLVSAFMGGARFVIIPIMACYAAREIVNKNLDLVNVLLVYFVINILIFYIRAFYSYDFFGVMDIEVKEWTYRPSNLSNPIIFSIEVAIFLAMVMCSQLHVKNKTFIYAIMVVPLFLMFSRSSYIIIFLFSLFYLVYNKRYISLLLFSVASFLIMYIYYESMGKLPYVLSVFDYEAGAYDTRFTSMINALSHISELNVSELLFGTGSGTASQHGNSNGLEAFYVENSFVSLVIENGVVFFLLYFFSLLYLIFNTTACGVGIYYTVIVLSVSLTNFFSANLTVVSVQLLYWLVFFYGLFISQERFLRES
ncbi:hypothetical protein [Paraferrimonas sp. SM1919]|uniref:hypothetical protein n=1 Tax=Paraferrimonas sp. SM1919 TaxID=2662263 RepID=UPI0013D4F4E3|nr:hypothetical protein [Paraferrimonas sp. SM1919]